jgi:hypothetical protein
MLKPKLAFFVAVAALSLAVTSGFAQTQDAFEARSEVGKPLQAAILAVQRGDFAQAMSLVAEARRAPDLSESETGAIARTLDYIAVKSGGAFGVSSAIGAQAKFTTDYQAARYRDAIADEELLRTYGVLTDRNIVVIAQAHLLLGEFIPCARYSAAHTSIQLIQLHLSCVWEARDDQFVRAEIVKALAVGLAAADKGCGQFSREQLQKARAVPNPNADEAAIISEIDSYIVAQPEILGAEESCRTINIEGYESHRTG